MVTAADKTVKANGDFTEFYLIGELSQQFGVRCGAIRFYEQQGLLTPTRHGHLRVFTQQDADRLRYILDLRKMGLPVKTIHKLFEENRKVGRNHAMASLTSTLEWHEADLIRKRDEIGSQLKAVREKLGEPSEDGGNAISS